MKDLRRIIGLEYAEDDLNQIYNYILNDSLYYAIKTTSEIVKKINYLSDFPYMGRKVHIYNNENIREVIYKSYKIIYEIDSSTIYIHRIFHSSRLFSKSILKIKSN